MNEQNAVPAHLRAEAHDPLNAAAMAGVVGTMAPARISYRGSRFRLVDKDGVESDPFVTNDKGMAEIENNGVAMDIVIVGANASISKIYYDRPWDPDSDTAPACFSDNGTAPSERARLPQSVTCAACPHNVWGSAVNPSTGKARQACNNVKKLAVVRYKDEGNSIYALGLPGASLKGYEAAMKAVTSHGYRIGGIIWRVSFDRQVSFPKLDWKAVGFLDADAMAEFQELQRHDEVRLAVGADDVAMAAAAIEAHKNGAALPKPTPQVFAGQKQGEVKISQRLDLPEAAKPDFILRRPAQPLEKTVVISGPMPAKPASPEPVPTVTPPGMPQHTGTALAQEKRGRGRPRKYPQDGFNVPPPPSQAVSDAPVMPKSAPPLPGPGELPAATDEMDDALSRAMGLQV
jgi:hypothetical protein